MWVSLTHAADLIIDGRDSIIDDGFSISMKHTSEPIIPCWAVPDGDITER